MASGTFERNACLKIREVLVHSLVPTVQVARGILGNKGRERRVLEELVVMDSSWTCSGGVEDVSFLIGGNLGFEGEAFLLARVVSSALAFLFRTRDCLLGSISNDLFNAYIFWQELLEFLEYGDLLPCAFSGILKHESVLQERQGFLYGSAYTALINTKEVFQHKVGRVCSCPCKGEEELVLEGRKNLLTPSS